MRQRQDRVNQADPQKQIIRPAVIQLRHILEIHAEEARDELERQKNSRHRRQDINRFFLGTLEIELGLLGEPLDVTQRSRDVVLELGDVLARVPARGDAVTEPLHSTPSLRASGTLGAHSI